MEGRFRPAFAAALLTGALVLVAFFVWHWFTIAPVWRVLVEGAVGLVVAALAVAWAWVLSLRAGHFGSRWGGLAFGAVFAAAVALSELLGLARGARPNPSSVLEVLAALPVPLVPVAAVTVAGAWVTKSKQGALAYGVSALVLVLYLGGNVVQMGGIGVGLALALLLVPLYLAAGVVFAAAYKRWT